DACPGRCRGAPPCRLRLASIVGDALPRGGTLPRGRLSEPEPRRRRLAALDGRRPQHRKHRLGSLVSLFAHPRTASRRLAGNARLPDRLPAEARRILQSKPGDGCTAPEVTRRHAAAVGHAQTGPRILLDTYTIAVPISEN